MARMGGETGSMGRLKTAFDTEAGNLTRLIENVDGRIREVEWDGSAAEKFKGAWSTEYKSKLNMLVQLFNESATEVQKRIEALEAASR
ncbi:MAG: hypothetical protein GY722_11495 [bacterium]|nr:hypothetical protein [bacterium]